MRFGRPLLAAVGILLGAAGCSTGPTAPNTSLLPADAQVTALLPIGTHRFRVEYRAPEIVETLEGYVELGADPDGRDCAVDAVYNSRSSEYAAVTGRVVGPGTKGVYHRLEASDKPFGDPGNIGRWLRSSSWESAPFEVFFPPQLVTGGRPLPDGGESVCTWRLFDRASTLASDGSGELRYDASAIGQLQLAADVAYTDQLDSFADSESWTASLTDDPRLLKTLEGFSPLRISKDPGSGTVVMQTRNADGTVEVTAEFRPAARAEVSAPGE